MAERFTRFASCLLVAPITVCYNDKNVHVMYFFVREVFLLNYKIPAGLALSKMLPQHIARKVLYLCLLLMFLPQQALILPQYLLLDRMHLLHHAGGVVLMSAFQPFLVLIFWFGSEQIHPSLFEAAICEGASTRQCFFRIYIPMLSPYILAGSLLSVAESWNMLEQPMTFLQTDSQLVLSTYFLQQIGADPSVTAIQALLSVFPLLLVFAFAVAKLHNPNSLVAQFFFFAICFACNSSIFLI